MLHILLKVLYHQMLLFYYLQDKGMLIQENLVNPVINPLLIYYLSILTKQRTYFEIIYFI